MRPALLADPAAPVGVLTLANVRLFDGTGAGVRDDVSVRIEKGRITDVLDGSATADGQVVDLEGRFLMPGLIDSHAHVVASATVEPSEGAEPLLPAVTGHLVAAELQRALAMGITTIRDVGSFGDVMFEVRQAMRYGAFNGPRLLVSGRIISPTSPGGRHFDGMYREADGPDEMRKAAREQVRRGADFVKIMTTGARSVELENPDSPQVTQEELGALVDEAHRLGYRVAAHCEGLEGTAMAIEAGVDTVEHGFNLHKRPELLGKLARRNGVLVPTLSFLEDIAATRSDAWSPHLVERGRHNVEQARLTLRAAVESGVSVAMGYDSRPEHLAASELGLMVEAGMTTEHALVSATAVGALALGLEDVVGTVEPGKLADLLILEADPTEDISILVDPGSVHAVYRNGQLVSPLRKPGSDL